MTIHSPDGLQNQTPLWEQPAFPEIDAAVDYDRAVAWLDEFGPTTLWAHNPITKAQAALWYDGSNPGAAAEWICRHNRAQFNIYQHVNLPRAGLNKKAAKEDIAYFRDIGADVDGDKDGRDMAAAWAAIGKVPLPPTFVVMSGAGFNAYWALKEPLPNTPAVIQRVEALGRRIAELTGGDGVQNADRVLRTPYTINWPSQTKITRGRVQVPSGIVRSVGIPQ